MKTFLIIGLLFSSISTHASGIDNQEQGIGFLAILCPVCAVGAVIAKATTTEADPDQPIPKEQSIKRELASEKKD